MEDQRICIECQHPIDDEETTLFQNHSSGGDLCEHCARELFELYIGYEDD